MTRDTNEGTGSQRSIWSREELVVVLDLYFRLPSSKFTDAEPEVTEIAALIGRTPAAVAMRLANYLALDENSGAEGLSHGGEHARKVWEEFKNNRAMVPIAAGAAKAALLADAQEDDKASGSKA